MLDPILREQEKQELRVYLLTGLGLFIFVAYVVFALMQIRMSR